jgi:hypothetical protein
MAHGRRSLLVLALVVLAAQGCGTVTIGLTMLGAAVGTVAGTGTAYTLDSAATRTFTAPLDDVRQAVLAALVIMGIPVSSDQGTEVERQIRARAANRNISLEMRRLTVNLTSLHVTAKHHWLLHDRATAGEIVNQIQEALNSAAALPRMEQ